MVDRRTERTRRAAPRRASGRSKLLLVGRAVAGAASAGVLLTAGVSWYTYHSLTTGMKTSDALSVSQRNAPPKALDNSVNLLLIGLDSRKDMNGNNLPDWIVQDELHAGGSSDVGGYNTNSLILLHIPAGGGKVQAFSIPRDDYVQTLNGDGSSQGMHKIKEAYGLAKSAAETRLQAQGVTGAALEQQSREAGREATLTTLQAFLGVRIDHFAEVNLMGFYDIAQAVQPITVCLNEDTSDPAISGQGSGASFHKGLNTLNAAQALSFVRQRHNIAATAANGGGSDFARTHRQQAFISSVEYKLKQEGLFSDLGKMQALLDVVKKDIVLDNQWNILDFAQQAPNLTGGKVVFNTLPITGFARENGEDVNTVSPSQIKRIMQQLIGHAPAPAPSASSPGSSAPATVRAAPAVVDVLNGSGVTGGAAAESKALVALGYTAGQVASHSARSHTTVLYGTGADTAAQQIAGKLGVASATASSAVRTGHVEVILGAGFNPPTTTGTGSGSGSDPAAASSTSTTAPVAVPMQGAAVQAGGIPCVD
ncbi:MULTISPECIES: LCP family protein [Streptacidiphilus]|uniref:LCP family protein n=1 Tax=Streptacidiphilus cavernicola TaxID=3342716 RepID=A0ABV6UW01_9ACTN|nr:LCP family protein [Streptacidiphilus jeojiense]